MSLIDTEQTTNMKKIIAIVVIGSMLCSCAGYRPIIDPKGVDMNAYESDLKECQAIAQGVSPGQEAATGAVAGAIFGALLSAAIGGRSQAGYGAKIGAVEGAGAGTVTGATGQVQVIKKCLSGRGYNILR